MSDRTELSSRTNLFSRTVLSFRESMSSFIKFIINLLTTTSTRVTPRTVLAYASDALYTDDPVLTELNIGEVAITNGRRATTEADGAVLGSDLLAIGTPPAGVTVNGNIISFDGTQADFASVVVTASVDSGIILQTMAYTQNETQGSVKIRIPTGLGAFTSSGDLSTIVMTTGSGVIIVQSNSAANKFIGDVVLTSIKQIIPTWYKTDINGVPFSPAPKMSNEDSATNELLWSRDLSDAVWMQRGTFSAAQNLNGADGVANRGWTLSGIDTTSNGDIQQSFVGLPTATRFEPSCVLKQISTSGVLALISSFGAGNWAIDLSLLSGGWEIIDRNHPAVTVLVEFDTLAGTSISYRFLKSSGTGTLSVGYFNSQLELGTVSTSQYYTEEAPLMRGPDINTVPVSDVHTKDLGFERLEFTPYVGGQVNKYLRSFYIDATHTLDLYINATQVIVSYVDGASTDSAAFTYSHLQDVPMTAEWGWDSVANKLRVRAAASSGDISGETFAEATFAGMTTLPATSYIGCKNDLDQAAGEFGNPIDYISAEIAGVL